MHMVLHTGFSTSAAGFLLTSSGCSGWRPENIAEKREGSGAFLRVVLVVVKVLPPMFKMTWLATLWETCGDSTCATPQISMLTYRDAGIT